MKEEFNIQSKSFYLYEAFKKEVEKIGYRYNEDFSGFTEAELKTSNCLYFTDKFNDAPTPNAFAFSNVTPSDNIKTFYLPEGWTKALDFAEDNYNVYIGDIELTTEQAFKIISDYYDVGPQNIKIIL